MPDDPPLWISEAEVVSLMNLEEAIEALERGLLAEAQGDALNMQKTHVAWNDSTLHAIGAVFPKAGFVGTKTWAHTPGGATPLLALFDSNTGKLRAVIEAFALGQMRTGAASGVATRWLAAEDAGELALIGTGKQALTQAAAVLAVRPIRRIRVFGRNEERRNQFASRLRTEFEVEVVAARTIAEATAGAPIVTVVTRATDPIVNAGMLDRGTHINAVGAIVPQRAELAADVLARCTRIVADSVPQARRLSRELIGYLGSEEEKWARVESLASLVAARRGRSPTIQAGASGTDAPRRSAGAGAGSRRRDSGGDDLTVFKSLGMGISDLALGMEIYQSASRAGLGRSLAHPQKVAPRLGPKQLHRV